MDSELIKDGGKRIKKGKIKDIKDLFTVYRLEE